jgi:HSP20 family molecular chaperone IbpA
MEVWEIREDGEDNMTMPMRREQRGLVPELFDWLEIPFAALRPPVSQPIKFEDYVHDGRYVLRAELPGIDPDKDVEITVSNGVLTIHAERQDEHKDQHRTEFTYGSFTRSVTLPAGVDENDIRASYDNGILKVSVKLADTKQEGKRVQIESTSKEQTQTQQM